MGEVEGEETARVHRRETERVSWRNKEECPQYYEGDN